MSDLAFLLVLTAWAAGLGLWLLRRFGPAPADRLDALGLALPLGLGTLALAAAALGEIGHFGADGFRTVLIGGSPFAALGLARFARKPADPLPAETPAPWAWPDRVLAILFVAGLGGTLLTALAPVTDGDALCYHLQVPKWFLQRGWLGFDPDLHETIYPLLTEMLYGVALAFRGPVACRLVQWLLGLTFALNVSALGRPFLGRRAWWAGAVALLVPAVSNGMSAPLNDVALAAFGSSALVAWVRFSDRPSLRAALLTGVLTGLAMGVKYPALVLAGLIGLAVGPGVLAHSFSRGTGLPRIATRRIRSAVDDVVRQWSDAEPPVRRRRRLVHALAFATAAWAVGGVWYARAFAHTGNPVHPFFRQTFGGSGLDEVLGPEKRPLGVSAWNILTAVAPLTLDPNTFDSVSHEFGPIFLLFLPALFVERPPRRLLALGGMGYAFLALCLTQRQSMRFVLTALGPLSVVAAWLAHTWWERGSRPGRILVAVWLLALTAESGLAVARARHGLAVVVGAESADHYLARREPTYTVGRWVDENLKADARIVGQDHRGFYIPRAYTMELAHRRRTGVDGSAGEVLAEFRRSGFTHVLLCPPIPETAVEFDPTLSRLLAPWAGSREPLYRRDLADADGVVRAYALYDLNDVGRAVAGARTRVAR